LTFDRKVDALIVETKGDALGLEIGVERGVQKMQYKE
jgi:hypothetical protein